MGHIPRNEANPARWRGHLDKLLPKRAKLTRGHHAAMDYADVPAFIAELRERQAMAAMALEFAISTAARSGEVLGARWNEIDLEAKVWTVPATRMKAGREHRVPLSTRALAILEKLAEAKISDFVFAGQRPGKPLSGMALEMVLRRMKIEGVTVHGFRSAFRDWAGEETHFPREIAEAALAHVAGDATERAYRRGDALEKRRGLMEAWANFWEPKAGSNVLSMTRPGELVTVRIAVIAGRVPMPSARCASLVKSARRTFPARSIGQDRSIIVGGLGATKQGGDSVPKIHEKLAPPRKYPSKSAP